MWLKEGHCFTPQGFRYVSKVQYTLTLIRDPPEKAVKVKQTQHLVQSTSQCHEVAVPERQSNPRDPLSSRCSSSVPPFIVSTAFLTSNTTISSLMLIKME